MGLRMAAIIGFACAGGCAHVAAPTPAAVVDEGAAALRRCIAEADACPQLAKRLEARLRNRRDAASAHRLAWQMTEAFGRGGVPVGSAVARCRAGHAGSCRALWWAIDRLYLADDASLARANDCGLTNAVAAAFPEARIP